MIREERRFDRRTLLSAAGSLGLGALAVGGLAAAETIVRTPTLTIIGEEAGQFSLLRTRGAEIGLLFGPPTEATLAAIVPMLGWTTPVLDVLAVSPAALTDTASAWLTSEAHIRSVLMLGPIVPRQMPALKTGVQGRVLSMPATLSLPHGVSVEFLPAFSIAATSGPVGTVGAMVAVRRGAQAIVAADAPNALLQQSWSGDPSLLVVPRGDLRQIVATMRPPAIAINSSGKLAEQIMPGDADVTGAPSAILRTFVSETAVVSLEDGAVRLPPWTKVMTPTVTP